jgi:hypothetical protein
MNNESTVPPPRKRAPTLMGSTISAGARKGARESADSAQTMSTNNACKTLTPNIVTAPTCVERRPLTMHLENDLDTADEETRLLLHQAYK